MDLVRIAEILRRPEGRNLRWLAGPEPDGPLVSQVVLVESPDQLTEVEPGHLAIFTAHASAVASGYRLDMALSEVGERGAAGIVIHGADRVSTSARRLSERGGVAVLASPSGTGVSRLLLSLDRLLRSDACLYLERVMAVSELVSRLDDVTALLEAAGAELGTTLTTAPCAEPGAACSACVQVDDQVVEYVLAGRCDPAVRLALPVLAAAVARGRASQVQATAAPARARSESVTELLLADTSRLGAATRRARLLGVPVDGAHLATCVGFDRAAPVTADEMVGRVAADEAVGRVMLAVVAETGPVWTVCRVEDMVMLVWSRSRASRPDADRAASVLARALRQVQEVDPCTPVFGGLGSFHDGVGGLRASASEATAAMVSARSLGRRADLAVFDTGKIRQFVLEMVASPSALASITSVLEPLESLEPDRRTEAVETLNAYLDAQGSYTAAGKRLQLHPNAVLYRIKRLAGILGLDLGDPDLRLAVHLACRARMIAAPEDTAPVMA
jgi:sugar diacid utilization regulator